MKEKIDSLFGFLFCVGCFLCAVFGIPAIGNERFAIPVAIGVFLMISAIAYANLVGGDTNERG